jgi:hypothetical protein
MDNQKIKLMECEKEQIREMSSDSENKRVDEG